MSTEAVGGRLLREVAAENATLKELLQDLRKLANPNPPRTGIPELDTLWRRHGGRLEIYGHALPLLYHIVNSCVSKLGKCVVVVDMDGRFDVVKLKCDLRCVFVCKPERGMLRATLDGVEEWLMDGAHGSMERELAAVVVNGGQGGDVMAGWRGWLRVERGEVDVFGRGISVEEAMKERHIRQTAVERARWVASSDWGSFTWTED